MSNSKKCIAYGTSDLSHLVALEQALEIQTGSWTFVTSSEALGRTIYKEYYAIFYRDDRMKCYEWGGVLFDPTDLFEREPFFASFRAGNFDFTIVVMHAIRPDKTTLLKAEVKGLKEAYQRVQDLDPDENDVILLGDFNVSSSRDDWWTDLRSIPSMTALIDEPTCLGSEGLKNPYDKIWIQSNYSGAEHTGNARLDLFWEYLCADVPEEERYSKAYESTHALSDHVLIWAEFRIDLEDDDPSTATCP
ncbi:hypothetical protein KAX17_14780 [Candidatus Bipolaricaulota bacterium]|nr:hypothetical protein [Candidatus Bipolaricaulota bacterium]